MENNINIVCIVYKENIDYIKTTLFSILINKEPHIKYTIYCLSEVEYSFEFLKKINIHISIKNINLNKIANEYEIVDKTNFKYNCMYYLDQILPDVNRIIYVNHELIFKKSLLEIWKLILEKNEYLSCVMFNREIYTNLILIDLMKIRKQNLNYNYINRLKKETLDKKNILDELKENIKFLTLKYLKPNINEIHHSYVNNLPIKNRIENMHDINDSLSIYYWKKPWEHYYVLYGDIWKQYYKECIYLESLK